MSAESPRLKGSPGLALTPGLHTKLAPISKAISKSKKGKKPPVSPGLPGSKEGSRDNRDSALKLEFLCDSLKVQEIMNLEKYQQPVDS